MAKVFLVAIIAAIIELAGAANHTVGIPGGGWLVGTNLSAWASTISFKTGDNLLFTYDQSRHDVLEVTRANYNSCNITRPIQTHTSGKDVIPLRSAGNRYFICGFSTHCGSGMKLAVNTTNSSSAASPPPGASPPRPGTSPPPRANSPPPSGSPPPTLTPSIPSGSPPQSSSSPPDSSTPSPPSAAVRSFEGKAAAIAGIVGVGMMILVGF